MSTKKTLLYLLVIVVIFGGQFFVNQSQVTGRPPKLARFTISGELVAEQINKGPALIYFWAAWCGICSSMQGTLERILQDYPGITIAMQSGSEAKVMQYLKQKKLTWNTITDNDGAIGTRYGIKGVPTIFFLGKDGKIKLSTVGYSSETGIRFRLWIMSFMS